VADAGVAVRVGFLLAAERRRMNPYAAALLATALALVGLWFVVAIDFARLCSAAAREDAADDLADAECATDWGNEIAEHGECI
jgi:hypothetical protein